MSLQATVTVARSAREGLFVDLVAGPSSASARGRRGALRIAALRIAALVFLMGARLFFPYCLVDRCGMWRQISLIRLIRVVIKS